MRSLTRRAAALAVASSLFPAFTAAAASAQTATPATPTADHGAPGVLTVVHGDTAPSRTAGPSTARHGDSTLSRRTPRTRATTSSTAAARSAQTAATTHSPTVVKNPTPDFKTLSLDEEYSTFDVPNSGTAHFVTPPDTQLAVSPTQVVEMVNLAEKVYSPANGAALLGPVDLYSIFAVPQPSPSVEQWNLSDPRVVYDPESHTWFATAISFQCADPSCNSFAGGEVYLATSTDPVANGWTQYVVASNGTSNPVPVPGGDLYDQAKLGVSTDKLTIGFDVYNPSFQGADLVVVDKAAVVAQAQTPAKTTFPSSGATAGWFSLAPAQSLTPTTTAYVAYNNSDTGALNPPPPSVGVISVSGVPGSATPATFREDDPAINPTSVPPAAAEPQPAGGNPASPATIDTGDDRFLNSVWRNGLLWTFGNDSCTPATDTTARACARLVQVATSGTPSVVQDFDVSSLGKDTYYPAVVFNGNGDSVGVFSESSATEFVSVVAGGQLSDEAGSFSALASIQPGEATHDDNSAKCFGPGTSASRWGDYSAAVTDPSAANGAWVGGEYAAAPTTNVPDCNWGTAAGRLTFQPPSVTSLSQNAGKNGGGDLVTITGANFSANATVAFSGTPAVSPVVVSSTKITVHTPALSNATTDVVVTTPYGTSIPTTASKFRFASPPVVTAVVPNIGNLAGGNIVTLTGSGFTAATAVHFGDALATNIVVASDSKMTVTAPAHAAGPVDVTVDVSSLVGAPHAGDTYTYKVRSGYWMVDEDGSVFGFGDSAYYGGAEALTQNTVVDIEPTSSGSGYWILDDAGNVFPFGDAVWQGQPTSLGPDESATSISANPTGSGYWVFTDKGRAFAYGDAPFMGDMAGTALNGPVLGSVATPTGKGYYMVASDGGIFSFGDAHFHGSMGGKPLNGPVVGLAPTPDNGGYWLVATDGGIFSFGDAQFHGSMGGKPLNAPMVGTVAYGDGYLMVGTDGGIFDFSSKPFLGSLGGQPLSAPISNVAPLNG